MTSWQEGQSLLLLVFSDQFPSLALVGELIRLYIPHHCCFRAKVQTRKAFGDSSWSRAHSV